MRNRWHFPPPRSVQSPLSGDYSYFSFHFQVLAQRIYSSIVCFIGRCGPGSDRFNSILRGFKSHRNCFFDLLGVIFKLLIIPLQFQAAFVPYDSKESFCK